MAKSNQIARFERSITSTAATSLFSSRLAAPSQSAFVLDSINMNTTSFEEYLNMANGDGTAGNEGAPPVENPSTPMTSIEASAPTNEGPPTETSSSSLQKKLLAARKTTPTSNLKSAPVKKAPVSGKDATPAVNINLEQFAVVPAVDNLLSCYPDLLQATSKASVIETIVGSNIVNPAFDLGDSRTYAIDYAQIESLADDILAGSATNTKDPAEKQQTVLDDFGFREKDVDVDNEDLVAKQAEKVLSLRTALAEKLNGRYPVESTADPFTSAGDEDVLFRHKATTLKYSVYFDKTLSAEDGDLLSEVREFDHEKETLRLLKEAAENVKAEENSQTEKEETPEEIHHRNMDFLAQDLPIPTMPFEEDYVERYSNDEDMAKIGHMLKPDAPLRQAYDVKKARKHKVFIEEEETRKNSQWKADEAAILQRNADMVAARAAGTIVNKVPEDDFFFTFGK
ncbi:hypothetical protein BKA65DRAFT_549017 [Rhexocercosporidium sp. MPI-PUGE-AT-0058]|nr:hypothetical protein BKA65DRAFT_549017 [Rhexocercosporidium sp. MPI-PUGE-AT-0058]